MSRSEDFREGLKVDPQGNVTVASERCEHLRLQHHGDKSDVRVVHGLEGDARVIAVEVAVLDQILDSIHDLDDVSTSGT